jgi:hypothetical protein
MCKYSYYHSGDEAKGDASHSSEILIGDDLQQMISNKRDKEQHHAKSFTT